MLSNEIGKFSWRKQKKQLVANFGKLQELTLSRCLVETHSNKVECTSGVKNRISIGKVHLWVTYKGPEGSLSHKSLLRI